MNKFLKCVPIYEIRVKSTLKCLFCDNLRFLKYVYVKVNPQNQ